MSTQIETRVVEDNTLDNKTVLILFLALVIVFIYLLSLLLIVIRRAKKLIELHNRRYYFFIAFYIFTKIIICIVLGIEIIVGIASSWGNHRIRKYRQFECRPNFEGYQCPVQSPRRGLANQNERRVKISSKIISHKEKLNRQEQIKETNKVIIQQKKLTISCPKFETPKYSPQPRFKYTDKLRNWYDDNSSTQL